LNNLVVHAKKLYTPTGDKPKRGRELSQIERLQDVYICIDDGIISEITHQRPSSAIRYLSADLVVPGFVDCHTHIPFYGYREFDFLRRTGGFSYLEIHTSGGGIHESVEKLREASLSELICFNLKLVERLFRKGVTTLEGKSGYGLDRENELKQLQVLKVLSKMTPVDLVFTFMGAHAIAKGKSQSEYLQMLIEMLDVVKEECDFVDVFCDVGAFDIENTERYLKIAKEKGFQFRLHADEIERTGATQLAVSLGAVSADHLLKITEEDVRAISESNTIAVLMPATSFYLSDSYAPARELIDSNAIVALGSDFNPGSSAVIEPSFVMHLAVKQLKMSPREVLTAFTLNSASVLKLEKKVGTIEVGKQADMLLYNDADLETLTYLIGIIPDVVIKRGQIFEN